MRDIIINDILIPSLQRLYKVDYNNIFFRVSERNICARLAYHLEVRMRRYDRQNQESRFAGNGLEEGRDFCMGLVHYRKDWEKFTYKDVPWELFHKEGRFKAQQEFRIALNPESQKMREMLKGGQEICIGSIEDCAMLRSHFYKGAEIRVKGDDVRLEVRDLSNMTVPPHEMEFVPLLNRKEKKSEKLRLMFIKAVVFL